MRFKVINLNRTPQRLIKFKQQNPRFIFDRFSAIDGSRINRAELVEHNLFTEKTANRYTNGAIGVALSHRALWQECVSTNESYTILEDDAYLIPDFNQVVSKYTANNSNWDFLFWGANLDQRIVAEFCPGIATAELKFNHDQVWQNIANITKQSLQPHMFRVHWAVGLMCYSVTPKSAQYLLNSIFPIKDYFDFRDNHGIDNSIIEELPNMQSYMSFPPIALTLNDRYNSTVQENNPSINN